MTLQDYQTAIACKLAGTWNLHNVALSQPKPLAFFTMLSSISGVVGQKGQANYAAANAFQDAFASYRHGLGLKANAIDLGAVEEIGYISRNTDLLRIFNPDVWTPINEPLFLKIMDHSLLQQLDPTYPVKDAQLVTGIAVPLAKDADILSDARFSTLCIGRQAGGGGGADAKDKELAAFLLLVKGTSDCTPELLDAAVEVINQQFVKILRLPEPMEPAKALSSYGLDSLAAVELRNWVRKELAADLTTLDVTNATSLIALCEKVVAKMQTA